MGIDAESVAMMFLNSEVARYFGGKCHHYINDFYGEQHNPKRLARFLDRFFPDERIDVRSYRKADVADMREAAIKVVHSGRAIIHSDTDPGLTKTWAGFTPERQAEIASGNRQIAIRLKDPTEVILDDPVQGPTKFKVPGNNVGLVLFYAVGIPSVSWANAYDDSVLEVTHAIREHKSMQASAEEVAMHEAAGTVPPQYIHLDVGCHAISGLDPYRISEYMPGEAIRMAVWEHLTYPDWPKTVNDLGFLRAADPWITDEMIKIKVAWLIMGEKNDAARTALFRVFFNTVQPQDLLRFVRFVNPGEGWTWPIAKAFVENAVEQPGWHATFGKDFDHPDFVCLPMLIEVLNAAEFTPFDLSQTVSNFAIKAAIHVNRLDMFLAFGCFGVTLPDPVRHTHLYTALCELGKDQVVKRLHKAVGIFGPKAAQSLLSPNEEEIEQAMANFAIRG